MDAHHWHLPYLIKIPEHPYTKLTLLSLIARINDPCGFLTPVIFHANILIQFLWTLGVSWDKTLPDNIVRVCKQFVDDLPSLQNLKLPCCLHLCSATDIQLHGFCDAPEHGYAASIYVRGSDDHDVVKTNLLIAKSKVAPLKTISFLELSSAKNCILKEVQQLNFPDDFKVLYKTNLLLLGYRNFNPFSTQII